mmetsp:Transcript_18885/g.22559  ORF Transcript_18885/g.22559 Transcript_18885/m.22559 type:complete len:102 (+) Transcript_18885:127-432(+)
MSLLTKLRGYALPFAAKMPVTITSGTNKTQSCFMGTKALIKTNKSAAKRFRVRGSGSIKRYRGGRQHNTGFKSRTKNNQLGESTGIKEAKIEKRIRRLLGK